MKISQTPFQYGWYSISQNLYLALSAALGARLASGEAANIPVMKVAVWSFIGVLCSELISLVYLNLRHRPWRQELEVNHLGVKYQSRGKQRELSWQQITKVKMPGSIRFPLRDMCFISGENKKISCDLRCFSLEDRDRIIDRIKLYQPH
ncbi:hypothetical protein [Shewanella atlantica]|uniref:Uncharacterized protein n=1 Tax=Shewanella atlantica TaxID=271099 RepID=A0A431W7D8_9GAMM|nr:hypothetical protein [Shewanella atlantica]RTR31317.1 hypothetical protein EKG39_14750 [Shewanella atlantica]